MTDPYTTQTLSSQDATHDCLVSLSDCLALRRLGTAAGEAAARFAERRAHAYSERQAAGTSIDSAAHQGGMPSATAAAPLHDPLAVMSLVEPGVLRQLGRYHVSIETVGSKTLGRSVIDLSASPFFLTLPTLP